MISAFRKKSLKELRGITISYLSVRMLYHNLTYELPVVTLTKDIETFEPSRQGTTNIVELIFMFSPPILYHMAQT